MTTLVKRRIELTVGTIKVSPEKRIAGKVSKSYKPEPNTCEVSIWNLSPDQRAALSDQKTPVVKLAAGYGSGTSGLLQLFYGEALHVTHEIQEMNGDIVTTIANTDSGEKKQKARAVLSFGKNTKTSTVLKRLADALGVGAGNVSTIAAQIDSGAQGSMYASGASFSGSAADEISHLLRSCGYDWSIQDGCISIRKQGAPIDTFAIELDPTSGLIGSPSISNKGICSGTSLIFKGEGGLDMLPGKLIHITSEFVKGQFILAKCEYDFDNYVEPWFVRFEAVSKKGDLAKVGT
jgi:hypothetical protein